MVILTHNKYQAGDMAVALISAKASGRSIMEHLFRYHVYDMPTFLTCKANAQGEYDADLSQLDEDWQEPEATLMS